MEERRPVLGSILRPTSLGIGVAVAAVVVILMSSARGSEPQRGSANSTPAPTSTAARAHLASLDQLTHRLAAANPSVPSSRLVWSAPVRDVDGVYRALWFGRASEIRADLDETGQVTKLSLHAPRTEDRGVERRLARMMVDVSAPGAPAADRASSADALGALMSRDMSVIPPVSAVRVGAVLMTLDVGALDYDLAAKPTA